MAYNNGLVEINHGRGDEPANIARCFIAIDSEIGFGEEKGEERERSYLAGYGDLSESRWLHARGREFSVKRRLITEVALTK